MTSSIRRRYQESAETRLSRAGYLDFLAQRPSNALRPEFADLLFLYQTVRRRKPRYILEFGSGCSTVIMAQGLFDNQQTCQCRNGYLYSLDAEAHWAEVTVRTMPPHLRGFCEVWHSPVFKVNYLGTPAFRHARLPDIAPDLLYLDGPTLTREIQVAVDTLDIEDRFPRHFYGIIDGRWPNTLFLRRHLKRRYVFKDTWLFGYSTFELVG